MLPENEVITRVFQCSILGVQLLKIYTFILRCQLCDSKYLYIFGKKRCKILKNDLEIDFIILKWFYENHVALKNWKCHRIMIDDSDSSPKITMSHK